MANTVNDPQDCVYAFEGFILDPYRRSLMQGEAELPLGSRALELLVAMLEQAGEILGRDHLTARVWPRTVVEESSLRVHVATLRRVLGDGRDGRRLIATIPGRGYGFIGEVTRRPRAPMPAPSMSGLETLPLAAQSPPSSTARLLGRERELAALQRLVVATRLTTVTGPGGVGKSSLAARLAARDGDAGPHPRFADLSSAVDEAGIAASLLQALALEAVGLPPADTWPLLVTTLRREPGLLVIDNCEHLIDATAHVVDGLLSEVPQLHVLVTSREPLNIEGEHVYRLGGLDLPPLAPVSLKEALEVPALQLLIERARASGNDVEFEDEDVAALHELVGQLDGLPLALELAAARVRALGLKGMLARLDDLPELLTRGRRTALPRHRSLNATMRWSYELLDEAEQRVLRALSVFPGPFSLTSAAAVAAQERARGGMVEGLVLRLVERSLVLAIPEQLPNGPACDGTCYRLMNTTRRQAAQLLRDAETDELEPVQARHAEDLLRRLALAVALPSITEELLQALRWCCASAEPAHQQLGTQLLKAGLRLIRQSGRTAEFQPAIERLTVPPRTDLRGLQMLRAPAFIAVP